MIKLALFVFWEFRRAYFGRGSLVVLWANAVGLQDLERLLV